jgi:hypothetical protein
VKYRVNLNVGRKAIVLSSVRKIVSFSSMTNASPSLPDATNLMAKNRTCDSCSMAQNIDPECSGYISQNT